MIMERSQWFIKKHKPLFVKVCLSVMIIGFGLRLLLTRTTTPFGGSQVVLDVVQGGGNVTKAARSGGDAVSGAEMNDLGFDDFEENCNIYDGEWVHDPSGPVYTNESCSVIQDHQNCMMNGRPDTEYLYWRWKPRNCELPRFDAKKFLELMRNKSWAFIGDSIARNHQQSLHCALEKVDKSVQVYHDKEYRSRRWHFPTYNFTLSVVWSPFLVKAETFENVDGVSTSEIQLHLDEIDPKWKNLYESFDYMIFSGGEWFLKTAIYYENNRILGCHYCPGKNLAELGFFFAYRKALSLVYNFITTSNHKGFVMFRTLTPDHFENGEWHNGGSCKRTMPFKEGEAHLDDIDTQMHDIEISEFRKAEPIAIKNDVNLKLLDTTYLSLLRPDGHPGPYRYFQPFANKDKKASVPNDCLHWCLPGPIDSWNDLVMETVFNGQPNSVLL